MTRLLIRYLSSFSLLVGVLLAIGLVPAAASDARSACAERMLNLGFYAFFDPVSFSADSDPESEDFDLHLGYEADLLTALEAMEGAGISFQRQAIPIWDDIWLAPAGDQYDIVGGGITILDSRHKDADGVEQITFTSGHITFRQSLLVRAADADRLDSYEKLDSAVKVGVLPYSTGEFRLLEITGYVDRHGVLAAGVAILTPDGALVADGSDDFVITPAVESDRLAQRIALAPPDDSLPHVLYLGGELGESEMIEALGTGDVDALARGRLGNYAAAYASDGAFVVTVVDHKVETGGFALDINDADLAACLDDKIDWLTLEGSIGFLEWLVTPEIFMARAELWNEERR